MTSLQSALEGFTTQVLSFGFTAFVIGVALVMVYVMIRGVLGR